MVKEGHSWVRMMWYTNCVCGDCIFPLSGSCILTNVVLQGLIHSGLLWVRLWTWWCSVFVVALLLTENMNVSTKLTHVIKGHRRYSHKLHNGRSNMMSAWLEMISSQFPLLYCYVNLLKLGHFNQILKMWECHIPIILVSRQLKLCTFHDTENSLWHTIWHNNWSAMTLLIFIIVFSRERIQWVRKFSE